MSSFYGRGCVVGRLFCVAVGYPSKWKKTYTVCHSPRCIWHIRSHCFTGGNIAFLRLFSFLTFIGQVVFTPNAAYNQCSAQPQRESVLTGFVSWLDVHPRFFLLACSLPYLIFLVRAPVHKTTYVQHNLIWSGICPGVPCNDNCSKLCGVDVGSKK